MSYKFGIYINTRRYTPRQLTKMHELLDRWEVDKTLYLPGAIHLLFLVEEQGRALYSMLP